MDRSGLKDNSSLQAPFGCGSRRIPCGRESEEHSGSELWEVRASAFGPEGVERSLAATS